MEHIKGITTIWDFLTGPYFVENRRCALERTQLRSSLFSLYIAVRYSYQNHLTYIFQWSYNVFLLWNVSTHICYFLECRASHLNAGTGSPCHQWVLDPHKAGATEIPRGVVNMPELHLTSTATQFCGALAPQGITIGVHPQESITVCLHYLCDKLHWQLLITCRWGGNVWGSCCLIK